MPLKEIGNHLKSGTSFIRGRPNFKEILFANFPNDCNIVQSNKESLYLRGLLRYEQQVCNEKNLGISSARL